MKLLLPRLAPLLVTLLVAAPSAGAQDPVARASQRYAPAAQGPGIVVSIGRHGARDWRYSQRSSRSHRGYTRRSSAREVWVPGRYEVVRRRVWVPGAYRRVWVPAVYDTRCDWLGRPYRVLVVPGHFESVQDPGHWEVRDERVWRQPHWEVRG